MIDKYIHIYKIFSTLQALLLLNYQFDHRKIEYTPYKDNSSKLHQQQQQQQKIKFTFETGAQDEGRGRNTSLGRKFRTISSVPLP